MAQVHIEGKAPHCLPTVGTLAATTE